jgi:hypothetical protein
VALVSLLALSGCAHDSNEALRVGDTSIDNSDVEAAAAPLAASLENSGVSDAVGQVRQSVASLMVFREVARRYAQEKGITPSAPDYAGAASTLQAGEDDPYVRLDAEVVAYLTALRASVTPRTPTEEEMRAVFDSFVRLAGPDVATYDQIKSELLSLEDYSRALALRDELLAAIDRYGLTVNPRYQPLTFQLLVVSNGQLVLVDLPLGQQGTGASRPEG